MARNEFRYRGALGGLVAADERLLAKETQKLENQNKALRAVALADQVRRDRAFAARERDMNLRLKREQLLEASRDNRLGEKYDDILADIKVRTGKAKATQEEVAAEYAEEVTETNLEKAKATTEATRENTRLAERRVAASEVSARASQTSAAASAVRAQVARSTEARMAKEGPSRLRLREAEAKRVEAQAKIVTANSEPEMLEAAREAREAETAYKKAQAEQQNLYNEYMKKHGEKMPSGGSGSATSYPGVTNSDLNQADLAIQRNLVTDETDVSQDDYAQIEERIAAKASGLRKQGVTPDQAYDAAVEWAKNNGVIQAVDIGAAKQTASWWKRAGLNAPVPKQEWQLVKNGYEDTEAVKTLRMKLAKFKDNPEAVNYILNKYEQEVGAIPKSIELEFPDIGQ